MAKTVTIGNAQGFWGDTPGAAARLVKQFPNLDYLTMDYLAEVSMSIMAIQREKDPNAGYAKDFLGVIKSLIPLWEKGAHVKIVTNAGGLNPLGCAKACEEILKNAGLNKKVAVVYGDDVLSSLQKDSSNQEYRHLENKAPLDEVKDRLMTANAYLGAEPVADLLIQGANIVITGRLADPSLTVGPCIAHHGWAKNDYDRIAGATIAGHLIECGTQVTGGILTDWINLSDKANIGFPIVEVDQDGSFVITKPEGTGGIVNLKTVKEQLLYEIGDPSRYISPDAIVSILSLNLEVLGKDRVKVSGAKGLAPPPSYKVSATYRDGYRTDGMLTIFGPQAEKKARLCGEIILQRVRDAGYAIERSLIECLGTGDVVGGVVRNECETVECVLRVAVADHREEALECFAKEIAPMVTSGPQGVTGYTFGRPHIRQIFGYWPCLIARDKVNPKTKFIV